MARDLRRCGRAVWDEWLTSHRSDHNSQIRPQLTDPAHVARASENQQMQRAPGALHSPSTPHRPGTPRAPDHCRAQVLVSTGVAWSADRHAPRVTTIRPPDAGPGRTDPRPHHLATTHPPHQPHPTTPETRSQKPRDLTAPETLPQHKTRPPRPSRRARPMPRDVQSVGWTSSSDMPRPGLGRCVGLVSGVATRTW